MFRKLDLELSRGINILVGKNNTGKSTVLEAIGLALTRRLNGRPLAQELSPYIVNFDATRDYIEKLRAGIPATPPHVIIDLFLADSEDVEILRGTNNVDAENACGLRIQAQLAQEFQAEYERFTSEPEAVRLVPTEYYKEEWLGFSGNAVSARSVPVIASLIDATTIRLQYGLDYHLQEIIRTHLAPKVRADLSREYRTLREEFGDKTSVKEANLRLNESCAALTNRKLSLAIDISRRHTWESSLVAHLDDLPFHLIGKGDQNALKTLLAIGRKAGDADVVLIEEPETHLSYTYLRMLLHRIETHCFDKQVVIATHSAYVLNKLGMDRLILLGEDSATRITDVPEDTVNYFKKLAGFDTLRLALSQGAILVEGPSDELIVQRAYMDANGKLPIEDGIDVISVAMSHKRFLDLAIRLNRRVWVVTDNDRKTLDEVKARFSGYLDNKFVTLHVGSNPEHPSLEPQVVAANDLETLNTALGTQYATKEEALAAMEQDKTGSALRIFESATRITMPKYIQDVVKDAANR